MRTAAVAITLLSTIIPAAIAVPQVDTQPEAKSNISNVAFGQQLQDEDQTNHWVVWLEGKSACPPAVILDLLTDSPCGMTFELPGSSQARKYHFSNDSKSTMNPV
ncbi:hypothetical protein F4823DRAFT_245551 [Ustulina deusta]|nr:hypothetical protein F4823DRAFT_245551 [Ustulina deusta]